MHKCGASMPRGAAWAHIAAGTPGKSPDMLCIAGREPVALPRAKAMEKAWKLGLPRQHQGLKQAPA